MNKNILLSLRYDGTNYHGWQVQKNALSVQEVFQNAVYEIMRERPDIKGCSRTDTGVHAEMYCVSMWVDERFADRRLLLSLNAKLPDDIAVYDLRVVPDDFHARYSCKSKQYKYYIYNSGTRNPFYARYSLRYYHHLDNVLLNDAAKDYIGTHDFSAFCGSNASSEGTVRTVYDADVVRRGDMVVFTVTADGFLYNMVRIMVGTLIRINEGKIPPDGIPDIIRSRDRSMAGQTAPPTGLFLNRVVY
ncbi:MAG: tRNA pseudouridine(38-40) synthase TruA [Clostridia bacterium]|nr:tRNA pseudouridine(38-40) synthase TruA [Clostridia bacterium]